MGRKQPNPPPPENIKKPDPPPAPPNKIHEYPPIQFTQEICFDILSQKTKEIFEELLILRKLIDHLFSIEEAHYKELKKLNEDCIDLLKMR